MSMRSSSAAPEVVIIGAGPAGLAMALMLRRQGREIDLIERFEQPSPVGSGLILQPTGLSVLSELGLYERIEALLSNRETYQERIEAFPMTGLNVIRNRLAAFREAQ